MVMALQAESDERKSSYGLGAWLVPPISSGSVQKSV
jgi:hypothetical protein